ncbi:MAG: UDP-N-acetylmuramoyl-L-alanine--D-glutamate ligase [Pseudanabaena sp. ELA607]
MSKAYVLGLGQSGIAAAKLLHHLGWDVVISDGKDTPSLRERSQPLVSEGIGLALGGFPDWQSLTDAGTVVNLIVVSPGIPWDHPSLIAARQLGIETIGEMELAWRNLRDIPWVAITGTNGKTTTTSLTAAIFQGAGLRAVACGNIGFAACDVALQALTEQPDWIIAELSSFQIEAASTITPQIGIWTTFTPDHLNRHYTLENYRHIKASLMHQANHIVLNGDDPEIAQTGPALWPAAIWTATTPSLPEALATGATVVDGWVTFAGEQLFSLSRWQLLGEHNVQNLLMAVAAARLAHIKPAVIEQAIAEFTGVAHRLEPVRSLACGDGKVTFINDSKATNYDAAEVGLKSVNEPAILIAGGQPKQGDATGWLKQIQQRAWRVLLIGEARHLFAQMLVEHDYHSYEVMEALDQAVPRSLDLAMELMTKENVGHAVTVLFSPACASFDQFANFEQRGDYFRKLCAELTASEI